MASPHVSPLSLWSAASAPRPGCAGWPTPSPPCRSCTRWWWEGARRWTRTPGWQISPQARSPPQESPRCCRGYWEELEGWGEGEILAVGFFLGKTRHSLWTQTDRTQWDRCVCKPLLLRSWPHSCTFLHQILLLLESAAYDHLGTQTDTHTC